MQPKATSVICFSWREIAAAADRRRPLCPGKSRDDPPAQPIDGVRIDAGTLDLPTGADKLRHRAPQRQQQPRSFASNSRRSSIRAAHHYTRPGARKHGPLRLGGKLSGSKRLVHEQHTAEMRFSYR